MDQNSKMHKFKVTVPKLSIWKEEFILLTMIHIQNMSNKIKSKQLKKWTGHLHTAEKELTFVLAYTSFQQP